MNRRAGIIRFCRSGLRPRTRRATAVRGQRPLLQGGAARLGMRRQGGFSLIELVVVIVLLGIAAVALLQQFSQAAGSLARNEQLQTAAQLAQGCAEHLLAVRRGEGYAIATAADCSSVTGIAGYTISVAPLGSPAACPLGATCEELQVTVNHGADLRAQLSLMLVDY